ncbi:MAG TPA: hypothetical protein VE198_07780 [Actinoallomurus sp.]|nr:hypothetical protein [Actinoallomurus sp.]
MRKKLSAAAGLVTISAAGALIMSSPAFAEGDIASITGAPVVAGPASATAVQAQSLVANARTVAKDDGRRRHRHRRHRYHRRHHRHHRHHWHHRRHHHRWW